MKQVLFGGESVSAVAMGCMRLTDAASVDRTIGTALECGVSFFDHADIYGGGECERLFGAYLAAHKALRDKIFIQTKCGIRKGCYDFSRDHIIEAAEGSLRRLGVDHADALLLHRPDTLMEPEEVAEAFDRLAQSGKVRHFGVSNHSPMQIELLKTAVRQPVVADQLQFSLTESGMVASGLNVNMKNDESVMHDGALLEYCRIRGITIQTWSPFQRGFFGGSFIGDEENYPALNAKLRMLAEKYGVTPTGVAAAWILRHPARMQLISGSMDPARIREITAGAAVELSREDWYSLYLAAGYRLP